MTPVASEVAWSRQIHSYPPPAFNTALHILRTVNPARNPSSKALLTAHKTLSAPHIQVASPESSLEDALFPLPLHHSANPNSLRPFS